MTNAISLTLKIWRQKSPHDKGRLETYPVKEISTDMSFLEMLDVLNEKLTLKDQEHFKKRHVSRNIANRIAFQSAFVIRPFLTPDFQCQADGLGHL